MIDISKLNENVTTPRLCRDGDDLYKLLIGLVTTAEDQSIGALVSGMRIVLHEYLALVLRGEFSPYEAPEMPEDIAEAFRRAMFAVTQSSMEGGMPLKEENGKMVFDKEQIKRDMKERHGQA